jgi:pimeloyl-ACP methyl ester carboxylesterase
MNLGFTSSSVLKTSLIFRNIQSLLSLVLLCFAVSACEPSTRSKPQLDLGISYGNFEPGMIDTIVFHPSEEYSYNSYTGRKPFFVRIWVPMEKGTSDSTLVLRDLFSFHSKQPELAALADSLNHENLEYVRSHLTRTIGEDDSTLKEKNSKMFEKLMRLSIRSQFTEKPKGKFPVILYHHGYDGWSHENFLFAEYMASHGFIVVGTNYEWPNHQGSWDKGNADISYMNNFIKHLPYADSTRVFAVGHSWGAQALLYYDNKPPQPFQTTISLHTTMEFPPKLDTITKYWPRVSQIMLDSTRKTSPTFFFAPEKPSNNYLIFRKSKSADYHYINALTPIAHDGFISLDNMRYFIKEFYRPKEDSVLQKQFQCYQEICRAIHEQLATNRIDWSQHQRLVKVE